MARRERPKYKQEKTDAALTETTELATVDQPTQMTKGFDWRPIWLVFGFGVLLYANTVTFDYALDDKLYITANEFTKKGFSGIKEIWTNDMMVGFFGTKKNLVEGGRYRPLALTTHAIEWAIFGENAAMSHFINVILYGFMGVALYLVLQYLFEAENRDRWWWTLPVLATMLFLAHPTHTEVGANIKSRDEIMSLLFALLSFLGVLLYMKNDDKLQLVLSGIWFWMSLASKESSVTFLGVVPVSLIFFPKGNLKKAVVAMSPMVVFTVLYLVMRVAILGQDASTGEVAKELMNKPYLNATDDERLASIFFTMWLYIKLLFWPHPLTHDYYPFHPFHTYDELAAGSSGYVDWSNPMALLSVVIYLTMFGFGLYTLYQRIKGKPANVFGYGALIYLGTFILFSNLFFDIGAFMNERFLFIPSLGLAIPLAWVLINKLKGNVGLAVAGLLLFGYSAKTIARNYAWENDYALATSDVNTSDGSAKVKMTMGSELLDQAKAPKNAARKQELLKEAEKFELQSLKIYPRYFPPLDILGNIYFEMGNYAYSEHYFEQALKMKPGDQRMQNNMEAVCNVATNHGEYESALKGYAVLLKLWKGRNKDLGRIYEAMGQVYGKNLRDLTTSKKYLRMARQLDPENSSTYQKIGIVYAMLNELDSAQFSFHKALELDPDNARVLLNLGVLYRNLGNERLANEYMTKAQQIDPEVFKGE
ncbi:MAG: tetratricopeptide repeat protein [Flavobacteriales bacterium]